ncbi:MAG: hypothetical protein K2N06_01065 [Oscillospiraceae bacterium]|nr:hypothetical protein [Oscillospiraceae bacterium]
MGRFSKTMQIKNNTDKAGFISAFNSAMEKRGFVPCAEDEAAKSYLLAFSEGGWVTFTSESEDVPQVVKEMNVTSFSVEVVDSDFAILTLNNGDTVIFGDGSGYGIEDSPKGERKFWEPLLADGKTWEQFSEARDKQEVFVEDALCEAAPILGIDTKYIIEDYNELLDMAESDGNIETLYFKEKTADKKSKPMTLNAAFVKVFGEALEPLGFKKIKSKYPYFVRVVSDEIIHYVTVANETADGRGSHGVKYKCFNVFCGVSTVYNSDIDFDENYAKYHSNFIDSLSEIYTRTHWPDLDMKYRASIMRFYYDPTDNNSLMAMLKKVLAVVEMYALPAIGKAVTLEKCMDYFGLMNHRIHPFLDGGGEGLLCTKLFSADEFVVFKDKYCERELEGLNRELSLNPNPKRRASLETRIEYIMGEREESKKQCYNFFVNSELQEKAPAELERRKKENTEKLRGYGLEL